MQQDLSALLEQLESCAERLNVPHIRELLGPYIVVMKTVAYELPKGSFVYRARKCDANFNINTAIFLKDISYPPAKIAKRGRANDLNKPVFYCSYSKQPNFFELPDLATGSRIIVSIWQTTEKLVFNNIGFTESIFQRLGACRSCPTWFSTLPISHSYSSSSSPAFSLSTPTSTIAELKEISRLKSNDRVREVFGDWFMRNDVALQENSYKISAAIAELHLGRLESTGESFAGVLYPSVSMAANGDNFAITPEFADRALQWKKAIHVRIESRSINSFQTTNENDAICTDANGPLMWLGRRLKWEVPPKRQFKFTVVEGVDRFGDYDIGQKGEMLNWHVTDEGGNNVDSF